MNDTPRFTNYASAVAGQGYHTVLAQRDADGWTLTLRFTHWNPDIPAVNVDRRSVPRQWVGDTEVRPGLAANQLVQDYLGAAWTAVDKGNGYIVELT
jgi:hypothetical protein